MEMSLNCLIIFLTYQTVASSTTIPPRTARRTTGPWRAQTTGLWWSPTTGPWKASTTGPWRVGSTTGPWRAQTTGSRWRQTTGPWWAQTTGPWWIPTTFPRRAEWRTSRTYGDMVGTTPPPRRIGAEVISNQDWTEVNPCAQNNYVRRVCQELCDSCELPDPCLSSPCQNGGTCSSTRREFTCTCPEATSGSTCEISCKNSCMDCRQCPQYVQFHEAQYPRYTDTIILSEEPCDNEYIREQCPLTCNTCRPGENPPEIPQPSHIGCTSNMGNPTKCWEIADFRMHVFCANIPYFTKRCSFECMNICFQSCHGYANGAVGCYTPDKRPLMTIGG